MNQAQFHNRVTEYMAKGMPMNQAIAQAAQDMDSYEDPFEVARKAAMSK